MSPARPLVIQTEHLDASCAAWLAERCNLHQCAPEEGARFEQLLAEASGLVIRTYTRVDAALLDRTSPNLAARVIAAAGVGGGGAHGPARPRSGACGQAHGPA